MFAAIKRTNLSWCTWLIHTLRAALQKLRNAQILDVCTQTKQWSLLNDEKWSFLSKRSSEVKITWNEENSIVSTACFKNKRSMKHTFQKLLTVPIGRLFENCCASPFYRGKVHISLRSAWLMKHCSAQTEGSLIVMVITSRHQCAIPSRTTGTAFLLEELHRSCFPSSMKMHKC